MKKVTSFSFAFLIVLSVIAQEKTFVIYSIKGNVSIVNNKAESKAKIGTILQANESIKVGPASFATLICNQTRLFTLNKSASYSISSLGDSCKESKNSVSANYVKYIWSEFTKAHGSPEKNRTSYMANVGAVSRSINNVWIDPKLDTMNYVSGTIPLSWKSYTDAEEFEFKLYNVENDNAPIFTKAVKKKHIDIGDILKMIEPGKAYHWSAMIKGEENEDRKYIRYYTKEEYINFYNGLKKTEAAETDAEQNFRLGFLLEENHFQAEAYNHYMKATQLAPTNTLYRSVFMNFKKDYEIK